MTRARKSKRPRGRPTDYCQRIADAICRKLADGDSLSDICKARSMPARETVWRWQQQHPEFRNLYARAREEQAEHFAEEIIAISDDGSHDYKTIIGKDGKEIEVVDHEHIQRSKLRVDARKWIASKLKPKVYGERQPEAPAADESSAAAEVHYVVTQRAEHQEPAPPKTEDANVPNTG